MTDERFFKERGSINCCTCHVLKRKPKVRGQSAYVSLACVEFCNGEIHQGSSEGLFVLPVGHVSL